MNDEYRSDIEEILKRRHDNGADDWATPDRKIMKGSPFTTLDSACMLIDLGADRTNPILAETAQLIFSTLRADGRFKVAPNGAIYPCHTINAIRTLCYLGYAEDPRLTVTWDYLLQTQYTDGGWRCNKFSYGRGPETEYSNPGPTLAALDAFRFTKYLNQNEALDNAVAFLLNHWIIRKPIGPCHYGIGSRFLQITYPFASYNLFPYVYILSYYHRAKTDPRFLEALSMLQAKLVNGNIVIERQNPGLKSLSYCKQGEVCSLGTIRYQEILQNMRKS